MRYDPSMNDELNKEPQLPAVLDKAREKQKMKEPSKYKVVLLNDDFTPMDWVVRLLVQYFAKTTDQAGAIMLSVHKTGKGIAGVYTKDIAETKAAIANQVAQQDEHPFHAEVEEDA